MSASAAAPVGASAPRVRNVLINGSSRGLGLEFVRQYVSEANTHVIATARNLSTATGLQELKQKHSNLTLLEVDVSSPSSIRTSLASLPALSVIINNAGIAVNLDGTMEATPDAISTTFATNVTGPLVTIQTVLPALQQAAAEHHIVPVVANISSAMSSIQGVHQRVYLDGKGGLAYRMSKAAVNMLTAVAAQEHPDIAFVSLHPGWVDTDMGSSTGYHPPLKSAESVSGMRSVIDNLKPEQSGHLFRYDSTELQY